MEDTAADTAIDSDLLDRPPAGAETAIDSGLMDSAPGLGFDEEEEDFIDPDIDNLHRAWRNEKYAPELLPFNHTVVEHISELVEFVVEDLEEARAEDEEVDPDDVTEMLRKADLERVRYVLKDYLRIRLWKLTMWPQHYMERENFKRLSEAERNFLREYWDIKKTFLHGRFLRALPEAKHVLDEKSDLMDMVRRPALNRFVFARVLGDLGPLQVPTTQESSTESSAGGTAEYASGRTYLMRYQLIRKFLMDPEQAGKVELV